MTYSQFAYIYDDFMEHAPYEKWVTFTKEMIALHQLETKQIVDLGCGTGEITTRLAHQGFDVTGVDLSTDMLTVAENKAAEQGLSIPWISQDIRQLEGFSDIDLFVSYCDVMNYVLEIEDIEKVLLHVYNSLRKDGAFIFDVHALPYVEESLINQTFADLTEQLAYIWFCEEGEEEGAMTHYLTFFQKQAEQYSRFDEIHEERTHSIQLYEKLLKKVGFRKIKFYADFSSENEISSDLGERIFIFAQK